MQNTTTEPTIVSFIVSRGEGRADGSWPVGETRAYPGYTRRSPYGRTLADHRRMHEDLLKAAHELTHPGYDKFDVEVVYSDGRRAQHRLDLDSSFSDLHDYINIR